MARYTFRELVIDSRTGLNPRKNFTLGNGNNYYITIKDIHDGKIVITDKTDRVDDAAIAIIKKRSRIKNGDILFTSIGRIGETAIVTNKDDTWDVNESVFIFTLNTDLITQDFFCALFQSKNVQDQLTRDSSGSTFKSIKMNQLEKMTFDIPGLEEQKKISNVLKKTNKLVAMRKEQLAKLDQLVKSRFIELFGDPIANPKKWEADDMKTICTKITDGEHGSVVRVESGNVFLNAKHIKKDGTIDWKTVTYTTSEVHRKIYARCNPEPGDILLTTTGTIGNVAIVPNVAPFSMDRGITLLKLDRGKVNSNFVAALLNFECIQNIMNANVHASAIGHLFLNQVMRIPVVIPPMELQNQFAAFVEQTDKSKLAIQQSLDKLELLKKSLMQEYFG